MVILIGLNQSKVDIFFGQKIFILIIQKLLKSDLFIGYIKLCTDKKINVNKRF